MKWAAAAARKGEPTASSPFGRASTGLSVLSGRSSTPGQIGVLANVLIRDGVSRVLIICSQHLRGDRQVWHRRHRILDGYLPGLNDCCKVLHWSADGNDANQLFINKLLYAKTGEFTPVAGVLDAAKW